MPSKIRKLLFGWFFEASCLRHDEGYRRGGSEVTRALYDKRFLNAMLKDSYRTTGWVIVPKLITAYLFYGAVRALGFLSFNYTKET